MVAYYFDRGVWFFGSHVENTVDQAGHNAAKNVKNRANKEALENGARNRALAKLLSDPDAPEPISAKYKDPVAAGKVSA